MSDGNPHLVLGEPPLEQQRSISTLSSGRGMSSSSRCPAAKLLSLEAGEEVVARLLERSFVVIRCHRPEAQRCLWDEREHIFARAFDLSEDDKTGSGNFRSVGSYTLGYKREGNREFFETRVSRLGIVEPSLPVEGYQDFVLTLLRELNSIGVRILREISRELGLDPSFLLDLVDSEICPLPEAAYSAAVLRICRYPPSEERISFGAHTDTSILTICPLCSVPGLEVYDPHDQRWVAVESEYVSSDTVLVLVGELLQIIFRQKFRASVHRVRSPLERHRLSSPLLMRGRRAAIIDPSKYEHHLSEEEVAALLADLHGVSMSEVHMLLDLKRRKCSKQNQINEAEWVLSAFSASVDSSNTNSMTTH